MINKNKNKNKNKVISFTDFTRIIGEILYGKDSIEMRGIIQENDNGKFGLYYTGGSMIKEYSRRRDAVRGAERLGVQLVA